MRQSYHSVEQVADLLGLHVKTVRGYIRDGRLGATRVGRQYRISREDLEAFTGDTTAPASRARRVEVSGVVRIDGLDQEACERLTTLVVAGVQRPHGDPGGDQLHVRTVYDEEQARLTLILLGDPAAVADLLRIVDSLVDGLG